jgi:hypothetical protein
MTAVACRVPRELLGKDLWSVLHRVVRREGETKRVESRLFVADSKVVYSPKRGLKTLENGVLSTLLHDEFEAPATLACLLDRFAPETHPEMRGEPWYTGATSLPFAVTTGAVRTFAQQFQNACRSHDLHWASPRVCAVCPPRFNQIIAQSGTKGEVSGRALREVLPQFEDLTPTNAEVRVFVDKHGGRNHYAALLQEAYPDGMVMVQREGMEHSQYEVFGLGRSVRFAFQPRADSAHFCVALASMVSKYVREMLMHEFNQFWRTHVPGLEPTAGYPTDATRYWLEIEPAAERLGLARSALWRER